MNNTTDLKSILRARLNQLGTLPAAEAAYVCWAADQVGRGRFQTVQFRQDCLMISCRSASEVQELKFQLTAIKEAVKEKLGWSRERKLKIRIVIS